MTTLKHEGIDMVERMRAEANLSDSDIVLRLHRDKARLNIALAKMDPVAIADESISTLRKLEVGIAYVRVTDPAHTNQMAILREAMAGRTWNNQPSDSTQYSAQKKAAFESAPRTYAGSEFRM